MIEGAQCPRCGGWLHAGDSLSVQVLDCATRITVNKTASGKQSWAEDAEPDSGYSHIRTELFTLKWVRARRGKAGAGH